MTWVYEHYRDASAIGIHTTSLVHEETTAFQGLKVYDTRAHGRLLTLDDMVMLTELDEFVYHDMLTHVPACIHADPRAVLVVGGGDGGCAREFLRHPGIERIVQCEIDERVTRACQEYIPSVAHALGDPRIELVFEDAVAYVERHPETFDVIVVDSTEPIGPAEALFRAPFFASIRRALRPGGVVAAQAESPFYAAEVLRELFAEVRHVFQHVHGYHATIPTYPGGLWTFLFASDTRDPTQFDTARAAELETKWFSPAVGRASFELPPFVQRLVHP